MYWRGCTGGDVLAGMYWRGCTGGDVLAGIYWWGWMYLQVGMVGGCVLKGWLPLNPLSLRGQIEQLPITIST